MAFASFDSSRTSAPMAEINMVPLIDVMLVLMVIFIVTAPLLTNTVLEQPAGQPARGPGPFYGGGGTPAAAGIAPARRPVGGLPLHRGDARGRIEGGSEQDWLHQFGRGPIEWPTPRAPLALPP